MVYVSDNGTGLLPPISGRGYHFWRHITGVLAFEALDGGPAR